ncbi:MULTISPECIES: ureidoglycolate dehydrogenase [Yersinia]|jgi:ureidoglycolate dehydrogenase (NAD+)|uniref:Ureidoglycolate dehydrogenase n=2 Tax=Yersinia intermedia TaxID=631 RepID=A0A0T9N1V9_YERIN|nr:MULTISPECIES: ureidoglycolate dehydrogenase [Yersinia]AJJ21271.1 ureidoglycolate dehydrogenase [Yersinia intermedia]ARB84701.1 ureidoglycolate dehydrogenase [Yersinia sp. FDAARGOS_228]AVL34484.1 ureidoglycolate dehydrogenase [Yersinia intermedia]EEQ19755.1 Ureidoglycolate dehydrogenase [Yersinia intermedia ATCC 29909]MCB5299462.1 ureidoglycolate dehydrogenase [Yersinia intermedia]
MKVSKAQLNQLIQNKIHAAGLSQDHAAIVADVLAHADARGIHSHGAVRVEYYAERISKGGINNHPNFTFTPTGPCSAVFDGDNGAGHVAAKMSMDHAIEMAKSAGVAVVGVRRIGHSGALSYFVQQAAHAGMIGISLCQSDPMVVPYGGAEVYYGTNPIAFAAPAEGEDIVTFDMATTVQAWGKVLDARSRNVPIPDTWAVDKEGKNTTDPFAVSGLLPIAGPKGYGLMMMVDILSGVLLGLPFGKHVSSMYHDLSKGRELGQLHIVLNPAYFTDEAVFRKNISQVMQELNAITPAPGVKQVCYPGQNSRNRELLSEKNGIDIVDEIYQYLISSDIYQRSYDNKSPFAS